MSVWRQIYNKDGSITVKYEPQFRPHKKNSYSFNRIYLGKFCIIFEAEACCRIAAFCYKYKKVDQKLDLGDNHLLTTLKMNEEENNASRMPKIEWLKYRPVPKGLWSLSKNSPTSARLESIGFARSKYISAISIPIASPTYV